MTVECAQEGPANQPGLIVERRRHGRRHHHQHDAAHPAAAAAAAGPVLGHDGRRRRAGRLAGMTLVQFCSELNF